MGVDLESILRSMRTGARQVRQMPTEQKNQVLRKLAVELIAQQEAILQANERDLQRLPASTPAAFRDRLVLSGKRILAMAESLHSVADLPDPVNELVEQKTLKNGLRVRRVRAPLGVIFMIFESRPNVILEAFSLAFKSGNSILLRGGSEGAETAAQIYRMIEAIVPAGSAYGLNDYDRSLVDSILRSPNYVDVVVPRGGSQLIEYVQRTSLMPIIKNDRGLCHTYVDEHADLEMALNIVENAKTQRPGVCNALETVLVHERICDEFLTQLYARTSPIGLRWHVDDRSFEVLRGCERVELAKAADWDTEYLDLIINCRVVNDLVAALEHIDRHGSKHSEAIITRSEDRAQRFLREVDAAAVYWNASTRFTDGFELGLGGELGISTQKLHVRGPVGLRELTTPRWIIEGSGQTRA